MDIEVLLLLFQFTLSHSEFMYECLWKGEREREREREEEERCAEHFVHIFHLLPLQNEHNSYDDQ